MTAMEPPAGGDVETLQQAKVALFRAISPADPAHYVRGQYDGYRSIDGRRGRLDDRDVRGAPARHRQLALVGRPLLHPHGQASAGHADRGAPRLQAPAAARLRRVRPQTRAEPARHQARPLDRRAHRPRRPPGRRRHAAPILFDMEFAERAVRAPTPYEVLLHAAHGRRHAALHAPGRRRADLADHAAAARRSAAGPRVRPRLLGPDEAADRAGRRPRPLARARGSCREQRQPSTAPQSAAAPRRSRRSPTTRSSRTAIRARSSRPTARSTGCACLGSTRRACSGACSTARRGVPVRAVRDQPPGRPALRARHERPRHDLEDAVRLGRRARRADDGPEGAEDTITPHTRPPADDDAEHLLVRTVECLEGRSRSSSSASRCSTTAARRRSGRSSTGAATWPTRRARA